MTHKSERTPPEGWWGKKHIREIRIGYVVLALIYVFVILIPLLYERNTRIPEMGELLQTNGNLICKEIGNRGDYLTGVKIVDGQPQFFTCSGGSFGARPDCFGPRVDKCQKLSGKQTTVWWFEQPVYLFSTQKRLVRLAVDGKEEISRERTMELAKKGSLLSTWLIFVMLGLFLLIVVGFERMIRRHGHE